ncbi:GNAT family N-acetyltransferase [Natronolimnohabitans innermongolicus]|uniref:N-acetyltransferase GCN5 n=1 Tax=Natronolimnohabitans innermongolicus JCM 12255 TaxID=1227499 RepID=L9WW08_9EURY|nr:GNAT family N-acetyltransferase [Natronolimnohabitans innermongolicus]ELY52508.1 N-acetyltransferase GCN5 [Natronolimnohabitans innermongolicus JCM 12255]
MTRDVRPATLEDVWAIHETARASWHAAYDDILGAERVDDVVDEWYALGDLESAIAGTTDRADAVFLVAEPRTADRGTHTRETTVDGPSAAVNAEANSRTDGGRPDADRTEFDRECAGFVHAIPWPEDDSVAYLARLHVSPDVWRDGTGTALVTALEDELRGSFDRLRLAVLADNDGGRSFAESRGFDPVSRRPNGLAAGLEEYVYEKPIADANR